jgi:RNA polymerase-binding transcription factor DksA
MLEPSFVQEIKKKLEAEKQKLEKELEEFARKRSVPNDWAARYPDFKGDNLEEEADEVEEYEKRLAEETSLEDRLRGIRLALAKTEKGDYGRCSDCGREIEKERLEAFPASLTCRQCKN